MDPAACRVIYIDDRFNAEKWITRDGLVNAPQRSRSLTEFSELPLDLQANVTAFLSVFNQVFVCQSGRSFSSKLSELHDSVKQDCTPIIACFDVGSDNKRDHVFRTKSKFSPGSDSAPQFPGVLRRGITFSSESDESYGLQLLSRIASDLQVDEGVRLIIPVAIVQPKRKDSYDQAMEENRTSSHTEPSSSQAEALAKLDEKSDIIDAQIMLQCLDAGALDVVKSPLDKAGIMGLTVHAYRIYKAAKKEQASFMAVSHRPRKASWVGMEEEKPYAYLREAMVKKLLKGICEPQLAIEDYQHRHAFVEVDRQKLIEQSVGKWDFDGHMFSEDELVYAGYFILNHALSMEQVSDYRLSKEELLKFMQGCRVAYNSFVLYHNFRHAVDVLQSLFYFLLQIGILPPYPAGSEPAPHAQNKSPTAKLLGPFEAMTLLISAVGHDVGHPGVNNMFLVKLNAPLAQLYNDQSVLEAFHCAAYSQILRRHWPKAFDNKALRKLMISSILATDMGVHSDYMQHLGQLQEKIHESKATDGWSPKDIDAYRVLTCGLLIKCADISNVARPWTVAEKWTHLLQDEFAHQGEMEETVGMETTLFGGPPELGNMLKLANGQIGFMTIFAHPLFANVADIIPAMGFAAEEILTNKGVWFTRAEQEKRKQILKKEAGYSDHGSVSPRSRSPVGHGRKAMLDHDHTASPLQKQVTNAPTSESPANMSTDKLKESGTTTPQDERHDSSLEQVAAVVAHTDAASAERKAVILETPDLNSADRKNSSNTIKANDPRPTNSDSALTNGENSGEASDTRRDQGVSMRAGSESIPVPSDLNSNKLSQPQHALSSFTFATSNENEPVRTYDPEQHYPKAHSAARVSAPMADLKHQLKQSEAIQDAKRITSAQSENTTITNMRVGIPEEPPTPSQSTAATSYMSDRSEDLSRKDTDENEQSRNQAKSAPMQGDGSVLRPSFSVTSKDSASRENSKDNARTTVFSNGDVGESGHRDRKASNTMGRRRSKIKLSIQQIFKKSRGEKSTGDDKSVGENTSERAGQT